MPMVLVLALLMPPPAASSASSNFATLNVVLGAFLEEAFAVSGTNAATHEFFPKRLSVAEGDDVHFDVGGFEGVLILPPNVGAQDWLDEFATTPTDPFSFVIEDPDEAPGNLKGNNVIALGTDPTCGVSGQPPCSVDGTGVHSSGLFPDGDFLTYDVTIDLNEGDFVWVVNSVFPDQRMKISVVDPADRTSQADIDAERIDAFKRYADAAAALALKLSTRQSWHRTRSGRRVFDAWAGYDTQHFDLLDFFPQKLKIRKDDRVRWHFDSLIDEIHTVSVPRARALQTAANVFAPVCDPDGDGGAGPDNPPDLPEPPFCSNIAELEFDIPAGFVLPRGNGVYRQGNNLESSGARGGGLPENSYTLTFSKRTSNAGNPYICMLHPFMRGRVVVK
jgi:plastocyanin